MTAKIKYEFTAKMWQYSSPMAWYFVSLPTDISAEIRANMKWMEEGWGRLKAAAKIANTLWETAIWFDTRHNTYLLPIKAEVRKKEKLDMLKDINIIIWI